MPREPYPDAPGGRNTLKEGQAFETFAGQLLNKYGLVTWRLTDAKHQLAIGENTQGVEFKLDKRCLEFGHLSIEVQEKARASNADWVDSGILRNDNTWLYVQGNERRIYVFAKSWLRRWYAVRVKPTDITTPKPTIRRFFLELDDAYIGAALILNGRGERLK